MFERPQNLACACICVVRRQECQTLRDYVPCLLESLAVSGSTEPSNLTPCQRFEAMTREQANNQCDHMRAKTRFGFVAGLTVSV